MPIDPTIITQGIRPVQPIDPMQTLAQVSAIQNQALQRREAQQRIALADEALQLRQDESAEKQRLAGIARAGEGEIQGYKLGNESLDEVKARVSRIPDFETRNFALAGITAFADKQSEINARAAVMGKNNADVLAAQLVNFGDLAKIAKKFGSTPEAVDTMFQVARATGASTPDVLDLYWHNYQSSDDPAAYASTLVDALIDAGGQPYSLGRGEGRFEAGGGKPTAEGQPIPEELKPDFSMYLPIYARDTLGIDSSQPGWEKQVKQGEFEAAKKKYEELNNAPWHGFAPAYMWTAQGLVAIPKSGPNAGVATPITEGVTPPPAAGQEPSGRQVQRPLPAQVLVQQRAMKTARVVLDDLRELASDVQWKAGAWARMTAPADKAKAKLNLDDALTLYQSSLNASGPLLARGYGHTGVLTELDVLSSKEAVGGIGDSADVVNKKFAHALRLMDKITAAGETWDRDQGQSGDGTAKPAGGSTTPAATTTAPAVDADIAAVLERVNKGKKK